MNISSYDLTSDHHESIKVIHKVTEGDAMSGRENPSFWADKTIDLLIMFLGLYAAMELQDFVDHRQDQKQYMQILDGFKDELKNNQNQRIAIESGLGSLEKLTDYGESESNLNYFMLLSTYAMNFSACYVDMRLNQSKLDPQRTNECKRLFKEKFSTPKPAHLELSPVYRRDVWRLYLAGGVQLFREFESKQKTPRCSIGETSSKKLAICIGSIYAELDEIETRVEAIQRLVNETYFYYQGVLEAEFKLFKNTVQQYKGKRDKEAIEVISKAQEVLKEKIKDGQQSVEISRSQMRSKIIQLKRAVRKLDERFTEVRNAIKKELN